MARLIRRALVLGWLALAAPPAVLALTLLFEAATWRGHFFAATALGLLALPPYWIWAAGGRGKVLATGLELLLISALGASAPRLPAFEGQVGLSQVGGGGRISLFAWLPELDQMVLGSWPLQLVDSALDRPHAARLRTLLPGVYGDLRLVGSTLGDALADLSGHTYVIVPAHAATERLPLLIYLHGSGGSFLAYQALLRQWAEAGRFVVVSPSFGIGNWQNDGGLETIEAARTFAEASLPVDPRRVALMGLSNGGRGVTRIVAADTARRWPVIIALSAVIETNLLTDEWSGREVLLLHGETDERIDFEYFQSFADELERRKAVVERHSWPAEDHFLWFSKPGQLQAVAVPWLAAKWGAARR